MVRKHRNRDKTEDDSPSSSSSSSTEESQKGQSKSSKESFLQKSLERRTMKRQMAEQKRLARLARRATAKATKMKCSLEGNETLSCTKNTPSKAGSGRAKKGSKQASPVFLSPELKLPKGFDRISNDDDTENPKFSYFDAMFDSHATLQYLQNGRKGELYQKTMDEAKREFRYFITQAMKQTNFGGCITPVYITPNESRADSLSIPPLWPIGESYPVWVVVGLSEEYDCRDPTNRDMAMDALRKVCDNEAQVVGLYTTLEYPNDVIEEDVDEYEEEYCHEENPSDDDEENGEHNPDDHCDLESEEGIFNDTDLDDILEIQFAAVTCTCEISQERQLPLQLKLVFASQMLADDENRDSIKSINSVLMTKLTYILENYPTLKLHLSSWNGSIEDTDILYEKFPERIWWGVTGSCSFARNSAVARECVLRLPWNRRLLESASVIPTPVAQALGRSAFAHSGCIPWVASSVASLYPKSMRISAMAVARSATLATMELYTRIPPSDVGQLDENNANCKTSLSNDDDKDNSNNNSRVQHADAEQNENLSIESTTHA